MRQPDSQAIIVNTTISNFVLSIFKCKYLTLGHFIFIGCDMDPVALNHEFIHTYQYAELTFVGFFTEYVKELIKNIMHGHGLQKAFQLISFKLEAEANKADLAYFDHRTPFAWKNYIKHR